MAGSYLGAYLRRCAELGPGQMVRALRPSKFDFIILEGNAETISVQPPIEPAIGVAVERYDSSRSSGIPQVDALLRGSAEAYVARSEGEVASYALTAFDFPRLGQLGFEGRAAMIHEVYTLPEYRGKGLAAFVIRRMVEDLWSRGFEVKVYAEVRPDNIPSLKAFDRAGFLKVARVQGIKAAGIVFGSRILAAG